MNLFISLVLLLCTSGANAFLRSLLLTRTFLQNSKISAKSFALNAQTNSTPKKSNDIDLSRFTQVGVATQALLIAGAAATVQPTLADTGSDGAVVVLGSGGKTGKLTVEKLASSGCKVKPVFRGEAKSFQVEGGDSLLPAIKADVTKIDTLEAAIKGASAVIFAASASSKGGNAQQVDYVGVQNVAKECVRLKVPRLVIISSAAVTRPDSLGFKITNLFGGIMDYKRQGEDATREAYKGTSNLQYVIIRPGGLLDGSPVGPGKVELNQGDTIAGEVKRSDVAECAAAAAISKTIPGNVVFEMYETKSRSPLQAEFPSKSGFERNGEILGADYNKLFEGLKVDA